MFSKAFLVSGVMSLLFLFSFSSVLADNSQSSSFGSAISVFVIHSDPSFNPSNNIRQNVETSTEEHFINGEGSNMTQALSFQNTVTADKIPYNPTASQTSTTTTTTSETNTTSSSSGSFDLTIPIIIIVLFVATSIVGFLTYRKWKNRNIGENKVEGENNDDIISV